MAPMTAWEAALAAGLSVCVAVLVLGGGPGRPRAAEAWLLRAAGRLAEAEAGRARASGLDAGRLGMLLA